jgi:hypothetical protein
MGKYKSNTFTLGDWILLGQLVLLAAFFITALGVMYYFTGFMLIGTFAVIGLLLSPLFLTMPANIASQRDIFLDPVHKGLTGNLFTED